jgi:hypothetical protein
MKQQWLDVLIAIKATFGKCCEVKANLVKIGNYTYKSN